MNIHDEDGLSYSEAEARLPETPVLEAESEAHQAGEAESLPGDNVEGGEGGSATEESGGGEDGGEGAQAGGRGRHAFREIVETVVVTLLIFLVVRAVIQNFKVDGDSMLPTLHSDQYLLVNKGLYFRYDANFLARLFNSSAPPDMRYLFHGPQRGDIVVFQSPTEPLDFIKRVIAVEGETVQIRSDPDPVDNTTLSCGDCGVYVNGVKLDEPYVKATPDYNYPSDGSVLTVPPGDVFVLGDNRRNSSDSHVFGPLDVSRIVGVAFLSYWPTNEWGFLPHPSYAEKK